MKEYVLLQRLNSFCSLRRDFRVFAVASTDNEAWNYIPAAPIFLPEGSWKQVRNFGSVLIIPSVAIGLFFKQSHRVWLLYSCITVDPYYFCHSCDNSWILSKKCVIYACFYWECDASCLFLLVIFSRFPEELLRQRDSKLQECMVGCVPKEKSLI